MAYWEQKTVSTWPIVFLLSVIGSLLVSCESKPKIEALPYYNTADFTPVFVENESEVEIKIPHKIANFSFQNQDNEIVTQKNVENKVHVANFFFTSCPTICPKMTGQMKKLQEAFKTKKEVILLSYSVTPWIDTPTRLHEYAKSKGIISGKWHLLTGNKAAIYELARKAYFAEENIGYSKDSTQFLHTEHFLLIDKTKRIRGVYNGTLDLEIEQLIKDIETLAVQP